MKSTTSTIRTEDLAVDHELADTASSIRFLLDVTPVNLLDARRAFFADRTTPHFVYGPLEDDPDVTESRIAAIRIDAVEDPDLTYLLTAKRHELELQLEMLRRRGTARFLELSIQLYGTVGPVLLGDAEALLELIPPPLSEHGERRDAAAFARLAEIELDHYRMPGVRPPA